MPTTAGGRRVYLPSCEAHEPKGQTGGENFGVLAEIPVLVD